MDIDATQKRVYGHGKQGAKFGHTKIGGRELLVRGLNALAATVSTPLAAPVIAAIAEGAWTPIRYPHAIWDDQLGRWVSNAEIAETPYTLTPRKGPAVTARLIVRRVRD